jgi:hypothetical protein
MRLRALAELWPDRRVIGLARIVARLLADLARLIALSLRFWGSIEAENLFLRRQLALYRERGVRPRRVDTCGWRIRGHVATGSSNRPRQCRCQP